MIRGSCLCGTIQYEIKGPVGEMGHCHCRMCQKAHGSAVGTYVKVNHTDFSLTAGRGSVRSYRSSENITRTFCEHCGSNLQFIRSTKPYFGLAAGSLDNDPGVIPTYQIWTSSKLPWWLLDDTLLSHETQPGREFYLKDE